MTDTNQSMSEHQNDPGSEESFLERYNVPTVLFLVGCLFVVFVLYQIVGGTATYLIVGSKVTRENVLLHRVFTLGGQLFFILVPTIVFASLMSVRLDKVFLWRMPKGGETFFAVLSLLFLQQVFQTYMILQERIPLPEVFDTLLAPIKELMDQTVRVLVTAESLPELAFVVLVVAIVPSIVEELMFRGLIQTGLERVAQPIRAAVISGLIFGAFHFNPFALLPLMGLGVFFGLLRMRSRSLVIAMTIHFLNNVLAVIVSYFRMDEDMVLGGGKASEAYLPAVFGQLGLFVGLFLVAFSLYWRFTASVNANTRKPA
ncbi:MAG: CPBP family intramembrane glutamic endopeptidase [Bacteroidota bacterium]